MLSWLRRKTDPPADRAATLDDFLAAGFRRRDYGGGCHALMLERPYPYPDLIAHVSDTGATEVRCGDELLACNPTARGLSALVAALTGG